MLVEAGSAASLAALANAFRSSGQTHRCAATLIEALSKHI